MSKYEPYPPTPDCVDKDECKKLVKHYIDINIPVDVTPKTEVGRIETECCGEPTVICADGGKPDSCNFILVQKVCVRIPVKYTFASKVGPGIVDCCQKNDK